MKGSKGQRRASSEARDGKKGLKNNRVRRRSAKRVRAPLASHGPCLCSTPLCSSCCCEELLPANNPLGTEGLVSYLWTGFSPSVFILFIPSPSSVSLNVLRCHPFLLIFFSSLVTLAPYSVFLARTQSFRWSPKSCHDPHL